MMQSEAEKNFFSPQIMGILNVTPDSFSDGGKNYLKTQALVHARQMISDGATIIDIGGESTRPGAAYVSVEEELERVIPVLEALVRECDTCISVDTRKPEVMKAALASGATMINDVCALNEPGALACIAESNATVCLMHMQGDPQTMQASPTYHNVVEDIYHYLDNRVKACEEAGIHRERIIVDPGFGFGKTLQHNLQLLKHLSRFKALECPILVGISRKTMIGALLDGAPVSERVHGSVAAGVIAWREGASIVRTHDVGETAQALAVVKALQ